MEMQPIKSHSAARAAPATIGPAADVVPSSSQNTRMSGARNLTGHRKPDATATTTHAVTPFDLSRVASAADIVTTAAFLIPAALVYQRKKTRGNALKGMALGALCQTVSAVLVNWLVMIPFYRNAFHMPMETIVGFATKVLPFVDTEAEFYFLTCAPFNLLKAAVISLITFLIYKPLSPMLHDRG